MNGKCSQNNILCTLATLCEETLLQLLKLYFWIYFSSHPHSNLLYTTLTVSIFRFWGEGQHNKGGCKVPIGMFLSPTIPPPLHTPPTHIPLIPQQVKIHVEMHHSSLPRASGGIFPLSCTIYFFCVLTLFLFYYCLDPPRTSLILD